MGFGLCRTSLCARVYFPGTVIVVLLTFVVFVLSGRHALTNVAKAILGVVTLVPLSYAMNFNSMVADLSNTLAQRDEEAGDTVEGRLFDPVTEIVSAAQVAPLGAGFGSEQVGGVFAEVGVMSFRNFD